MNIYLLFATLGDFIAVIVIGSVFAWLTLIVGGIRYLKRRDVKQRALMKPICTWEYPEAEWLDYAAKFDLAKLPKGSATIKITLLDVWVTDADRVRRIELDGDRKCVADCEISGGLFNVHVCSWAVPARGVNRNYTHLHLNLPIPTGREAEAARLLDLFKENMIKQEKKIEWVIG